MIPSLACVFPRWANRRSQSPLSPSLVLFDLQGLSEPWVNSIWHPGAIAAGNHVAAGEVPRGQVDMPAPPRLSVVRSGARGDVSLN